MTSRTGYKKQTEVFLLVDAVVQLVLKNSTGQLVLSHPRDSRTIFYWPGVNILP